jgi:hypothetical protein
MVIYAYGRPFVKPGSSDFFHPLVRYCGNAGPDVIARALTITVAPLRVFRASRIRPDSIGFGAIRVAIGANGNVFFTVDAYREPSQIGN